MQMIAKLQQVKNTYKLIIIVIKTNSSLWSTIDR